MPARRFSAPWTVDELDAAFVVRDANGQALDYFYLEKEPGRRSGAKLLTRPKHATGPCISGLETFGLLCPTRSAVNGRALSLPLAANKPAIPRIEPDRGVG
jgi:hypothetical protein